jgi:hypothetical protein
LLRPGEPHDGKVSARLHLNCQLCKYSVEQIQLSIITLLEKIIFSAGNSFEVHERTRALRLADEQLAAVFVKGKG